VTGYTITPVLARVRAEFRRGARGRRGGGGVPRAARFPDAAANYRVESRAWRGQRRHYYVAPYGPYYIWGATARILKSLADRVA
jgi:hypothetical protein